MLRTPLPWIVLSLLAIAYVAFWDKSPTDLLGETPVKANEFPHAYMTDIELMEFGADGTLHNVLITSSAEHFQTTVNKPGPDDVTLLENPQMIFRGATAGLPWFLSAETGRIEQNGRQVTLLTNVNAHQDSEKQGLIEIQTDELHIKTAQQYAETDKAVNMRARQGNLSTIGMKAYLSEDRIELLSKVRGTYEP